jgi:hypothetical protein
MTYSIRSIQWNNPDWISSNIESFHISVIAFNGLKWPVFSLVLQQSKEPEGANTQVWRTRWVEKAFKLRIRTLYGKFTTIGIVLVNEKWSFSLSMAKSLLSVKKIRWNMTNARVLIVCLSVGGTLRKSRYFTWNHIILSRCKYIMRTCDSTAIKLPLWELAIRSEKIERVLHSFIFQSSLSGTLNVRPPRILYIGLCGRYCRRSSRCEIIRCVCSFRSSCLNCGDLLVRRDSWEAQDFLISLCHKLISYSMLWIL